MQRIEKIAQTVKNETEKLIISHKLDKTGITADDIVYKTNIDRANVSRMLNALWKEGKLIKLQGKPIRFLDADMIKSEYPVSYIPSTITKNASLIDYISKVSPIQKKKTLVVPSNPLDRIVGANGSLKEEVRKVVSAVSYPPFGLPVMILGNPGSGKRKFITAIYYYSIQNKLIDENSPFRIVNCSDYSNHDELFAKQFLGVQRSSSDARSVKGFLESTAHGILYLDGIDKLSTYCQNIILDCIQNNFFSRIGENGERPLETMIVTSFSDLKNTELISSLEENFPIHITLPNIDERPPMEKIEMILSLFLDEAISIKKNIYVHSSIILLFGLANYDQNESQLRNEIKSTCAKAILDSTKTATSFTVEYSHLSHQILSIREKVTEDSNAFVRSLQMYKKEPFVFSADGSCEALDYYRNAESLYAFRNRQQFIDSLYTPLFKISSYSNYINDLVEAIKTCDEDYINEIVNKTNQDIFRIIYAALKKDAYYHTIVDNLRMVYLLSYVISRYINETESDISSSKYEEIHPREYQTARDISKDLAKHLIETSCPVKLSEFICNYLYFVKNILNKTKPSILVICHGASVASEMCSYASSIAKSQDVSLEAIDYNNSLQFNDLLELAKLSVQHLNKGVGVVILVDTSPLDGIDDYIQKETQTKIKLFSSVSLNLLYSVIESCGKCEPIESLVQNTNEISYKESDNNLFINRFIDNVVSRTALFVNPKKAAECLQYSLQLILKELNIEYTEETAVKFLSHSIHMIERIVRNNPLPYNRLKQFTNEHFELMNIISKNLANTENTFDIKVPDSEIAYLTEIFLNL